ncbi:hypothetical protein IWW36_001033 [Coemansia brasiliensis]|uniref:Uncharacterized protein n=1 Tax=Coemansia brasiliensis TaxID=2650707 RepID=A0A9W8M2E0_9FUNG|nr:hypothetical protein IWW36_001033 [Coemansia brasiliensis]
MRWNNRVLAGAGLLLIQAWQAHAWAEGLTRNVTRGLVERAVGGCPAGYTNCEVFGCMEGSDCPQTCSDRTDSSSCSFSVNGVGCKWSLDKCIQDLQCNVGADGSCPDGCQGCGVFQCINLELKCPVPCKYREQEACNTDEMYNGIGCAWNNNRCITWDVINAMPLDGDMIAATEDLSPVPSTAVEEPESSSSETSSSETSSSETSSSESSEEPSSSSSEESSSSSEESSSEESSSEESSSEESSEESSSEEPTEEESSDAEESSSSDEAAGTSDKSSGPNLPVIIGIGAGVLILIGLISWGVLWYCTKKKKERQQMQARMQMGNANDEYMPPYVDYDAMYRESAYNNDYDDSPEGISSYNKKSYYTSGFSRNDANKPYQGW